MLFLILKKKTTDLNTLFLLQKEMCNQKTNLIDAICKLNMATCSILLKTIIGAILGHIGNTILAQYCSVNIGKTILR